MRLKEELGEYVGDLKKLQHFKIAMLNKYRQHRMSVYNNTESKYLHHEYPEEHLYNDEDFKYHYFEVPFHIVTNVMSELGTDTEIFETRRARDLDEDIIYTSFNHQDFWDYITKLKPYDFLVSIVAICKHNTEHKSLKSLKEIAEVELKNFKFEFKDSPTVFVALYFNDEMEVARQAIQEVLNKTQYSVIFMDIKEHNEQIVPEIFYEIDKCSFVIADVTFQRSGVYYEAGYAKGKDKPVIFTCQAKDFINIHFDIAQMNIIKWENKIDLEQRLSKRISALKLD